jgi:hypothetical protein
MTAVSHAPVDALEDHVVLAHAVDAGFRLVRHTTDTGSTVWEWRRGDEPRPQFVSRHVALHWMAEFLARNGGVSFVSNRGEAFA